MLHRRFSYHSAVRTLVAVPVIVAVSLVSCAGDESSTGSDDALRSSPATLTDTHPTLPLRDNQDTHVAPKTNLNQAAISDQLLQADEVSERYEIVGQNTRNFAHFNSFLDAAGWNAAIDSLTMKSCPEGYELFCRTRDMFAQLYQRAGGDVQAMIQLIRATDYREPLYRLAVATDRYEQQYPNVYLSSPSSARSDPR